ncbi:hypothetical protein [Streptomyces sp. NPDC048845]|uniref:hypothetical protein n=1 Tax=Streptomyces sp. NPDC048845 TaxID=3155390 RepID=UPI0034217900
MKRARKLPLAIATAATLALFGAAPAVADNHATGGAATPQDYHTTGAEDAEDNHATGDGEASAGREG